jgi:hypothetical protein
VVVKFEVSGRQEIVGQIIFCGRIASSAPTKHGVSPFQGLRAGASRSASGKVLASPHSLFLVLLAAPQWYIFDHQTSYFSAASRAPARRGQHERASCLFMIDSSTT